MGMHARIQRPCISTADRFCACMYRSLLHAVFAERACVLISCAWTPDPSTPAGTAHRSHAMHHPDVVRWRRPRGQQQLRPALPDQFDRGGGSFSAVLTTSERRSSARGSSQ